MRFQHTAARRRLTYPTASTCRQTMFQHTAARRRLAKLQDATRGTEKVSTHSRPKAAGRISGQNCTFNPVSTHSRPKAAVFLMDWLKLTKEFQHTAARRRLLRCTNPLCGWTERVSTHSRPKAADKKRACQTRPILVSTHSRPKAAVGATHQPNRPTPFQHTAARRRLWH